MRILTALLAMTLAAIGSAVAQTESVRTVDPAIYDPSGLFSIVDQNDDNKLSLAEYMAYVDRYASQGDVTSINIRNNDGYEGVFRHYDRNGDGQLTREELGKASRITLDSSLAT